MEPPSGGGEGGGWPGWDPAAGGAPTAAPPGTPPGPGTPPPGDGMPPPGYGAYPPQPKGGSARTGPLPLHPMTLSDILDGAFNLFKAEARTIVLVAVVFLVPIQIAAAFLQRDYLGGTGFISLFGDPTAAQSALDSGTSGQGWATLVAGAATVMVLPFVAGAVSRIVSAAYLGERMTAGQALRAVASRWWAFILAWLLVHLLEGVGFLLCVLPGFLVMALFIAVAPAIAIEGLGPIKAMKRSFRLVKPRLWPVLGIAVLSGLLATTVGSVLGGVPTLMAFVVGLRWGWLLLAAGSILSGLVSTPLIAIVATLVYYDGRIRQEGLDLQIMAADLARGDVRR
ncbi:MAG: hypothetical protein QOI56_326 [Actinomycetota bacterium]|nr:hypothetical protein [Actinomycetota bacterium]